MVDDHERDMMRLALATVALSVAACGAYDVGVAPASALVSLRLSLADSEVEVGQFTQAMVMGVDQYGEAITTGSAALASSRPDIAAVMPTTGRSLAIAPGTALITASADGKSAQQSLTVSTSPNRINEVEPDGDGSGVSGYLVVDESSIPLGLGPVSQVHAFGRFGVQVDAFTWQSDPITAYGRCPEGTGGFVITAEPSRGAANRCSPQETSAMAAQHRASAHAS